LWLFHRNCLKEPINSLLFSNAVFGLLSSVSSDKIGYLHCSKEQG